jgi:hypothetical protein
MERKQGTDVCAKLIVLLFMRLWYFNRAHFCHTLIKLHFNDIILVSLTLKVFSVPEWIYSTTNICDVLADWWHRLCCVEDMSYTLHVPLDKRDKFED